MQTDNKEIVWTPSARELAMRSLHKWHGTPHKNRLNIPGIGIDCIKLVAEVLVDSEIVNRLPYGSYSVEHGLFEPSDRLQKVIECAFHVERVAIAEHHFGDIPIFRTGKRSAHMGFLDDENIWHALANRSVTHSNFNLWSRDVDVLYRITARGWKNNPQVAIKLYGL